jgi:hypothetical protein
MIALGEPEVDERAMPCVPKSHTKLASHGHWSPQFAHLGQNPSRNGSSIENDA